MLSCNLPPALFAEWLGSFMCYCGTDTEIKVSIESWHRRKTFSHHSCRDSNPRPFDLEFSALTIELFPLPCNLKSPQQTKRVPTYRSCLLWSGTRLSVLMRALTRHWPAGTYRVMIGWFIASLIAPCQLQRITSRWNVCHKIANFVQICFTVWCKLNSNHNQAN